MSCAEYAELKHLGMNTVTTHGVYGRHAAEALNAVRDEAARLEENLSRFIPGSEVDRINRSAGVKCERLSDDAFDVLTRSVDFSRSCQGLFDITIGSLVSLWRGGRETGEPPGEESIRQVLPLVDYTALKLDPCKKTAALKRPGQKIDLGGIGKGFAGDRYLTVFRDYGISSAFTNIGGNVVALGAKPDGSPWRVGIQHPRRENSLIGVVSVCDKAVVTSGDYQRYFIGKSGQRYHHILNPVTGYPAESGLIGVTVVADSSMDADALSTTLFVAGMERGFGLLKQFPGAEAIFIGLDLAVHVTAGLRESFQAAEGIDIEFLN